MLSELAMCLGPASDTAVRLVRGGESKPQGPKPPDFESLLQTFYTRAFLRLRFNMPPTRQDLPRHAKTDGIAGAARALFLIPSRLIIRKNGFLTRKLPRLRFCQGQLRWFADR